MRRCSAKNPDRVVREMSAGTRNRILTRFQAGETAAAIAADMHISRAAVLQIVQVRDEGGKVRSDSSLLDAAKEPKKTAAASVRVAFTNEQLKVLQETFETHAYPDKKAVSLLCQQTGLERKRVNTWFCNARARRRITVRRNRSVPPDVVMCVSNHRFEPKLPSPPSPSPSVEVEVEPPRSRPTISITEPIAHVPSFTTRSIGRRFTDFLSDFPAEFLACGWRYLHRNGTPSS